MKPKLYKLTPTKIPWADYVWGISTGCDKVSSGCMKCYAETFAIRFWKGRPFNDVRFHPERLNFAALKTEGNIIFVNSMSDLFHGKVYDENIIQVINEMYLHPNQWFVVLTKRPKRAKAFFDTYKNAPSNLILGVSVEDASTAEERLDWLLKTDVKHRIVSIEPYLPWKANTKKFSEAKEVNIQFYTQSTFAKRGWKGMLEWVIVGAETGPGKRYCDPRFIEKIVNDCLATHTPVYVKQIHTKKDAKGKFKVLSNPYDFPARLQYTQFMRDCSIDRYINGQDFKEAINYMYPKPVINDNDGKWTHNKIPHAKHIDSKKPRELKNIEIISVNINGGFTGIIKPEDYK